MRILVEHEWPGNVRELKNAVESAAIMAVSDTVVVSDLESLRLKSPAGKESPTAPPRTAVQLGGHPHDVIAIPAKATLTDAERILIKEHLERAKTNAEAAATLGIGLRTLYTKLREFRLEGGGQGTAAGERAPDRYDELPRRHRVR
jgi:DNA-binding NtrC family response regulator